jgi:hypothetical protein
LIIGCLLIFIGAWIDKGLGMIGGGFVPNPLHEITEYVPTQLELGVSLGIYATASDTDHPLQGCHRREAGNRIIMPLRASSWRPATATSGF